ncbi:MAG TPA: cation diffusion facilitator family transporter [Bacteroidales bacterium]|nr:cation diffusion facilitator family transporter [Bacteroidales bacterium]
MNLNNKPSTVTRFAWLSIAAAITTIAIKVGAYFLTGSVGLLSDAMESGINLIGALMALSMLIIAIRPADEDHPYGHSKAEYFSSAVEGMLILVAAVGIGIASVQRFIYPKPLEQVGFGLVLSTIASLINLFVSLVLFKAAKKHHSITLEADAKHLMTDVWTSGGVIVGVAAVSISGWQRLDPIVAFFVACNIVWSGVGIVRKSISGLMDAALPVETQNAIQKVLEQYEQLGIHFHALQTRQAGARQFVSVHVLVPGEWTVQRGHELLERIEADLRNTIHGVIVSTHLESLDDPASWEDIDLDRPGK